jgi:hypothetical protein
VINAAEDVAITENRLRKRRLERELEEEEDFFRERDARESAQFAGCTHIWTILRLWVWWFEERIWGLRYIFKSRSAV